jgi:hypothetical protein
MKHLLLAAGIFLSAGQALFSQCTTTNATSCVCEDGSAQCLLLPDITASWMGISDNGFIEYPQTGAGTNYMNQGPDDGRLRVTGSTPNIGHGPFTVRGLTQSGMRTFLCGNDTVFNVAPNGEFECPNGDPNPKQLIIQRIYEKNSNSMSFVDQYVGSMTYHPAHGHNHVDDWAVMTLRVPTSDPNPLNWPIVGTGAKIGFCLMDYGQCGSPGSTYDGHCRDDNTVYLGGNVLYNVDFPNWNLGGGNYNCSVIEQGISSGWTDVYGKHLDGMWINIPPNTCNGDYYIVLEVDSRNVFIEERDDNNWTAIPVTLTQQLPAGTPAAPVITSDNSHNLCDNQEITLTASGAQSYLWSTGDTTQSITVSQAGSYTCEVASYCGTNMSEPFVVNQVVTTPPVLSGDTVCVSGAMTLSGTGTGTITWYDSLGILVGTGDTFTTPVLNATTTYYAMNTDSYSDTLNLEPHTNGIGGGGYIASEQYEVFTAHEPFTLSSVLVYAQNAGNITVQLQDEMGMVMETTTVAVPAGASRVQLDFPVPADSNMRLVGTSISTGGLYRNNNSAVYPYEIHDLVSITGASAGASYYYYFYDWELLTTNSTCGSAMVSVNAVVESCLGIGENIPFKRSIKLMPNPNNGNFAVEFATEHDGEITFELLTAIGTSVYQKTIPHASGINTWNFQQENLAKGLYIFNMHYEGKDYPSRIIIE